MGNFSRFICRIPKKLLHLYKMYIKKVRPMNMKWKVALLTLLGFSTAACCNTKKLGKSEDAKSDPVETETEDPRIMLMYGVPFLMVRWLALLRILRALTLQRAVWSSLMVL